VRYRSIAGFIAFFISVAIAVTVFAGEGSGVATVDNSRLLRNTVVPPVVNETYKYYEIGGCCEKDLLCDLKEKCVRMENGRKADSTTNWKMSWDYGYHRSSQACTANSFTVTVDVVFNLPKWVPNGKAPAELVEKWNGYMEKLIMHEKGHRDRAVEAANVLTKSVYDLPPADSCGVLDREINDLIRAQRSKLIKEQEMYDEVTKHGATQGAVFP